jgi:hypothetical protein
MSPEDKLFRAVITKTYKGGGSTTALHGPFTAKAPATSVVNEEKHILAYQQNNGWGWQGAYKLTTRIETCAPTWEAV